MAPKSVPVTRLAAAWQPAALIRTKLYIPQVRPKRVARHALLARLDQGWTRKLTLIAAPAGFGKTTLVSDWLASGSRPAAWVSLDARDNDPARFAAYVSAALGTLELGFGPAAGLPSGSLEAHLTALINQATEVGEDFALILDDYHVITEPAIHAGLSFLLEHLPAQMHLVLTSRSEPPLPVAQQRARGELVELRAADLRFTRDEVRAFLNETMQLDLAAEAVAALEARSEGWVVSLQLAALAAQAPAPTAADNGPAALDGSHRFLVDYLAEQVLLQQPPEVQAFLIATAPLERLCAPLCAAVCGVEVAAAQALLDYLDRANLFLTPLDDQRQWYRYHPLFAEFLQARLRQGPAERWAALNQQAAEWCAQHQLMEDAVRYALAARDYDRATRLIEAVAETLWGRSQILTMRRWLQAMPADLVRAQPRLGLQMAWAHAIYGQLDEVEPCVAGAAAQLGPAPHAVETPLSEEAWHATPGWLHAQVWLIRAFVARFRGGAAETLRDAQRALALTPANCARTQSVAHVLLGHAHLLLGHTAQADAALAQAVATSTATRNTAAYVSAINYLAFLRLMQGQLRAAIGLYRVAVAWVDEEREPSGGAERLGLGTLLREQNDLDAAEALIEAGLRRAEASGDFTFLRDGYVARARLAQARGAWEPALASIAQAEAVARRSATNTDLALLAAWRARICLAQGDRRAASEWAAASGLRADDAPEFLQEYGHLTLARVLLAQGQARPAEALLARLYTAAEAAGCAGRLIEIGAVQALVQQALGRPEAAQAALGRALALAEPEGFVRVFADEGDAMAALLAGVRGERRAYAERLRAACLETARAAYPARAGDARPVLAGTATRPLRAPDPAPTLDLGAEPLSEREVSVLRLIAAGLSNNDIAEALVVAPSTIQWHVKNIYSKLAVHSRTQAALAARELGLVG